MGQKLCARARRYFLTNFQTEFIRQIFALLVTGLRLGPGSVAVAVVSNFGVAVGRSRGAGYPKQT